MQVFSPMIFASGACVFDATCALANPSAGRGRPLRSTAPSAERFVRGSDLPISSRADCDWPTANVHSTAQRLDPIKMFSRPGGMRFPPKLSFAMLSYIARGRRQRYMDGIAKLSLLQ